MHVPINYALRGEELSYPLAQSGARAVLADPAEHVLPLRDADDSLLAAAPTGEVPWPAVVVADTDLVQLLPVPEILRLAESERIGSLFLAPTGGILVASREVEGALYNPRRCRRCHPDRHPRRAVDRGDHRRRRAARRRSAGHRGRADRARQGAPRPVQGAEGVCFVEALPRNQSGKLLERDLRAV